MSGRGHHKKRRKGKRSHWKRRKLSVNPNKCRSLELTEVPFFLQWLAIPTNESHKQFSKLVADTKCTQLDLKMHIIINHTDMTWSVNVHGKKVPQTCKALHQTLPLMMFQN